jgi:hypothetical protein
MCLGNKILLQQDYLDDASLITFDPHIYIIGRRPRISINPKSIRIVDNKVYIEYLKHIGEKTISIPTIGINHFGTNNLTIKSDYPYTEYIITDNDIQKSYRVKAALQLINFGSKILDHLKLEILYIGQAYGTDGSRNAVDRIKNHSTLQGIYSELIKRTPDQEIWMVLCDFNEVMLASFDGITKTFETSKDEDDKHFNKIFENKISEQQEINFTEAALIKYFQPEYNKVFKDSFPNPAHSTYSECYDLDLNMVCVEINTEDLLLPLWTNKVKPSLLHFAQFPLHSREDRKFMLDFT